MPTPDGPPTAVAAATFDVPALDVWSFRLDFMNLPRYNHDVRDVSRVADGSGVGGALGSGARYTFELADTRRPGRTHPVELWIEAVVMPTLVSAGMRGGNEAYEEFAVRELPGDRCEAALTLWVALPDGLPAAAQKAAAAGSLAQIQGELVQMKEVLEGGPEAPSVH